MHADNIQAIKQIFPKLPLGHCLFEWPVRGGNQAHVNFDRLISPHALERAGLQHAQDLRLRRGRHVADFIQKNRAAIALLEFANALAGGSGERSPLVPEQFALEQLFRNGRAIHRQEWLFMPVAMMIDRARHQFFARAALARNQCRRIRPRQLADQFEHLLHGLASADDSKFVIFLFEQRLVRNHLAHVAGGFERIEDDVFQLRDIERLQQVVVRSELHRFDRGLRGAVSGHENYGEFRIHLADSA
jgi:hypothetical protein